MRHFRSSLLPALIMLVLTSVSASAAEYMDTVLIPSRAVFLVGNTPDGLTDHQPLISILYSTEDLHFNDPRAPRFLFIDRQGRLAMGIGGYVKGTMQYDMDGAINNGSNFNTINIPVPANPALRNQFYASAAKTTIFLRVVGHTGLGDFSAYVQTDFSGGGLGAYQMKLKQANIMLGNVTVGLARSTFVDASAGVPVIDDAGPAGQNSGENVLVQYRPHLAHGFTLAVSAEMPRATYTTGSDAMSINQRIPDIPAYVQYSWVNGSHVRLSGIMRQLSYRDLVTGKNEFAPGWGVMLSGVAKVYGGLQLYWQGTYGKGIARYLQDLGGAGFDLIESPDSPGHMIAPGTLGIVAGLQYNFSSKFFMSASFSESRLYNQRSLGGDTYRDGQYYVVNGFYNILPDLQVGAEYLHGERTNVDSQSGHANRVMAMLKYSF